MSLWTAVLAAGVLAWLTKLAGYLVPQRWLSWPWVNRVMAALPVALLAALVFVAVELEKAWRRQRMRAGARPA